MRKTEESCARIRMKIRVKIKVIVQERKRKEKKEEEKKREEASYQNILCDLSSAHVQLSSKLLNVAGINNFVDTHEWNVTVVQGTVN